MSSDDLFTSRDIANYTPPYTVLFSTRGSTIVQCCKWPFIGQNDVKYTCYRGCKWKWVKLTTTVQKKTLQQ